MDVIKYAGYTQTYSNIVFNEYLQLKWNLNLAVKICFIIS